MGTGGFFSSDLYSLHNVTQNTQIIYPKELIIATLREFYAKDSKFHYVKDEWGFPQTPDHTDLPPDAGSNDDITTRIYIGQEARFDAPFYPAVLVKIGGATFVPISFNEENECVQYGFRTYNDGYTDYNMRVPVSFIYAGAWNLTINIDILTESSQDRATIAENISMCLISMERNNLTRAGLFIKSLSMDSESTETYQNDFIYKNTITLECRGEYRREVPIENFIDIINICVEFGDIEGNRGTDPNLTIQYTYTIENSILDLVSSQ